MNAIKTPEELFHALIQSRNAAPGAAFPILVHSVEYGEAVAVLMLEDEKRLAELVDLQKVSLEWKFGFFIVNGVGLVLLMLSIAKASQGLGSNVSEIWINHQDLSQGPDASLLSRVAEGRPILLRLYNSQGELAKTIHTNPPPLLRAFATAALEQLHLLEPWTPSQFYESKKHFQNKFGLEFLWNKGASKQMAVLAEQKELIVICYDPPEIE